MKLFGAILVWLIGLGGLVSTALLILKLAHIGVISWWAVVLPVAIPTSILLATLLILFLIIGVATLIEDARPVGKMPPRRR